HGIFQPFGSVQGSQCDSIPLLLNERSIFSCLCCVSSAHQSNVFQEEFQSYTRLNRGVIDGNATQLQDIRPGVHSQSHSPAEFRTIATSFHHTVEQIGQGEGISLVLQLPDQVSKGHNSIFRCPGKPRMLFNQQKGIIE